MSQSVLERPTDSFADSDANRHARPLRHAKRLLLTQPLDLELGGCLSEVVVAYETYGRLSPSRDNAVLICHALSGDSHVAAHDDQDDSGWWDCVVGPGKSIDTDRYFVICPNILGGCRGTTGPNTINPATGKLYGIEFPVITIGDMVEVQKRLVDVLRIDRLLAVVGGSLGGHMVLTWATRFPDRVAGAVALATSARLTSQAVAFDVVGRNAILRDPAFQAGKYHENGSRPSTGLAIARMLGHITYLSREAMTQKFDGRRCDARHVSTQFETKFAVGSYLAYQGDRFVERFDANSYLTLTTALDRFDLGETLEELASTLRPSRCRWLLASFTTDWLFPPFQSQQLVDALIAEGKPVTYCNVQSDCGHDAFLLPNDLATYGELVRAFLDNLDVQKPALCVNVWPSVNNDPGDQRPTSIFRHRRIDYDSIIDLITPEAGVLDLGCGTGGLLARLRERGHQRILGVEIDEQAIVVCARRGIDVVHADVNRGLPAFANGQFDYVVLSQTLQAVTDVEHVLGDMLRVGRRAIVSFPNIAYRKFRHQLAAEGRAPRLQGEDGFAWHDTPNVRCLSIADFEEFCNDHGIHIEERIALNTGLDQRIDTNPNLNADVGVFVLSR
jgi:homoserine O-acetyltransferase